MTLLALLFVLISLDPGPPWQRIMSKDGVDVSFLFHRETRGDRNGVVVYLTNRNSHQVEVSFEMIFRTPGLEHREPVRIALAPQERKTGSEDGLFWVPFDDICGDTGDQRCYIGEVGLRQFRVATR
jgi:hypothetical protein